MMTDHTCLHEDQLMGQSRAIERLSAELDYKKERLDDLKADNKRMEDKIDEISKNVNSLMNQSNENDTKLEIRLTAIETEQKNLKKQLDDDKEDSNNRTNRYVAIVALGLTVLTIIVNVALSLLLR
jgi:septal ring factor EnvC (AmiA/AmiB activator)